MFDMRSKIRNNESGFTLVELLVVILIIGVLAAIAIPIFLNQRQAANEAALKSDVHSIQLSMENCALKQKTYPDILVQWSGQTQIPACVTGLKTSAGTRVHAFDFAQYYPASGVLPGAAYCIESTNDLAGITLYFRSDKGNISNIQCPSQ